jgi:hypothetical protein
MILYNITFKVDHQATASFKQFLEEEHLPDVYAFKLVESHQLYRLLEQDDSESITLCLQYFLPDLGTYRQHEELLDYSFKKQIKKQFGDKVLYFSTVLKQM